MELAHLRGLVSIDGVPQAVQGLRSVGAEFDVLGRRATQSAPQVTSTGQAINRAGSQAQASSAQFRSLQQGLQQLSPVALTTTGAVVGVGLAVKGSVDASIGWESALAGVAKTLDTTGLSAEQAEQAVADMGAEIRNMALAIPVTATELAGIAESAGQLGIARENVVAFTEVMAKLAVTTDLTSEQAATSFAKFLNITGASTDTVDELASSLVYLGNNSATTESAILGMATRIASAGAQAGFSDAQILGMAAALSSLGLEAEAGGTAASRAILTMREAVIEGTEALDILADTAGQSAADFAAAWNADPQVAFASFLNGLARIDAAGGNSGAVLDDLGLSGLRVSDTLRRASSDVGLMTSAMDGSTDAALRNVAANDEAAVRFETTASKVQLAHNRMHEAAIVAGDELVPAYIALLELGADLTGSLGEQAVAFGQLKTAMTELDPSALGDEYVKSILLPFSAGPQIITALADSLFGLGGAQSKNTELTLSQKAAAEELLLQIIRLAQGLPADPLKTYTSELDFLKLSNEAAAEATDAYADSQRAAVVATLNAVNAHEIALASYDREAVNANVLNDAVVGLAGAYQSALAVQGAFLSQGSEYASIASTIEGALEAIQEKQRLGLPLSEKEIVLLEESGESLDRLAGRQRDSAIEAGLAALAADELTVAQDALNEAQRNGVEDLGPYIAAVEAAEDKLGLMGSAAGDTQSAQEDLASSINGPLIGAIGDLTRAVEYISKPWLIEIDAATDDAERELERLKGLISAGAVLPISIVTGTASGASGLDNFAEGGISQGGMALVGERGPELVFLPRGAEVMSNSDSKRFLGGFADGTLTGGSLGINSGGSLGVGGSIDESAFMDIGAQIGAAIRLGIELELIDSGVPTGEEYAKAIIAGATKEIEVSGPDGMTKAWSVATDRIPELAANLGQDTVLALLEQYADLEGQLELALLSGSDTGKIQAQLDALFALFAAWSGNTVGEVEAVWDALTDEARAAEAEAIWGRIVDSVRLPSVPGSYSLEDIISGAAQAQLAADFAEIFSLQKIALEMGDTELAAALGEQLRQLGLQEEFIQGILGTDFAQQLVEDMGLEQLGNELDARLDGILGDDPLGIADRVQAEIDALQTKIDLGPALGVPQEIIDGWMAERDALNSQQDQFWLDFAAAFAQGAVDPAVLATLDAAGRQQLEDALMSLYGQGAVEAMHNALDTSAADREAALEQLLSVPIEELANGDFLQKQQEKLEELYGKLSLAEALGLNTDALLAEIAAQEELLAAAGEAMASPVVQAVAAEMAAIPQIGADTLAQLTRIFEDYPEVAKDMIDDVIDAVLDGRLPFEDAMKLLANIPKKDLLPALERLEEQLTVKLAEALLSLGPDSPEVQALLKSLELLESAAEAAGAASEKAFEGIASAGNNYGNVGAGDGAGGVGVDAGGAVKSSQITTAQMDAILNNLPYTVTEAFTGRGQLTNFFREFQRVTGFATSIDADGLHLPQSGFVVSDGYINPFGDGGIVTRPTLALIGEKGEAEGVFPLSKAQEMGFGGGGMSRDDMDYLANRIADLLRSIPPRFAVDSRDIAAYSLYQLGSAAITGQARNR